MLFMAVSTQWRTSMSGLIGLDYNALRVVIDLGGFACDPADFAGVRVLEAASLKEMRRD